MNDIKDDAARQDETGRDTEAGEGSCRGDGAAETGAGNGGGRRCDGPAEGCTCSAQEADAGSSDAGETAGDAAGAATEERSGRPEKNEKKKVRRLEARIAELEKQLEAAGAAGAEKDKQYMLLYAEYDNFRRRTQKEKDGIYGEAYSSALNSLLPVFDNLYRALEAGDSGNLAEGLRMTVKSYEETLSKMGVREIEALGKTFNPELHSAVLHVEDESRGEGEIVEVLARGYEKDGKVIRYPIVKVAN
jgi:molecular chaperone GrpE